MSQQQWNTVDDYFNSLLVPSDDALEAALRDSEAAGLPRINVTPTQGKLLQLLAQIQGARRILEIGTLGGYSTIWLGRALPADGLLISLEANASYADIARVNLARAGLAELPRSASARHWTASPSWPPRTPNRSTWSSSTRTRPTTRTTWSGSSD